MLNMLNQFYKYLSEKTLDYFYDDHIKKGDRFFIELDEDEQVNKLYDIFKEIGNVKNICNSFNYKHEDGQNEYKTFSLLNPVALSENVGKYETYDVQYGQVQGITPERYKDIIQRGINEISSMDFLPASVCNQLQIPAF